MCGILTVIRTGGGALDPSRCRRALSSLSWRGPDLCVSSVWRERVFLGQTVLSLTGDIEDRSGRHTRSASGRYVTAFNGEIYNFRELAERWLSGRMTLTEHTTDTEVLANLHEVMPSEQVAGHLDGMYAYTVLDQETQRLDVCRDVQGEKSLYLYDSGTSIVIASEIPAILALVDGIRVDTQALRDYFRTRHFMLFSRTAYEGVRQILPGRVERLDLQTNQWSVPAHRQPRDWIDPARLDANRSRSLDDLADELDALLIRCTRGMRPDRRTYAAVVSGGVDSSLLGHYLVTHANPDVLVAVDHVGKDRISSDLSGFERALGRSIDVLHVDQVPYAAEIVRCQRICAGPLHSHSFVPQSLQSAHVRSKGCRVLFGGEGGDELFGGYDAYVRDVTPGGRFSPSPYLAHEEPEVVFEGDAPDLIQRDLADAWADALNAYRAVGDPQERTTLAMMYGDAAYQLSSVGLRGADLMSMMWSVETRSILLRRPIVEFALNLPMAAKIDRQAADPNQRTKVLLKKLFVRYYPASLLVEKQGFAGFPNESAAYLGQPADFLAFDALRIRRAPDAMPGWSRATQWKLANVEYFLRSRSNGSAAQ